MTMGHGWGRRFRLPGERRSPRPLRGTPARAGESPALIPVPLLRIFGLAAAALLICGSPAAAAGPLDAVRLRDRQIREILAAQKQGATAANEERLRQVVNGILDYEAHTRASFGRYWEQLSAADRNEALRLMTALLEASAMEKVRDFPAEKIQYVSETVDPPGDTGMVLTRVTRGTETAEVAYRMQLAAGRWRIVDILVEGASSVESNRAAFAREIRASGVRGLLEKLRRKAERKPL